MDEKEPQRMVGRDQSTGDESKKGEAGSFMQNSLVHHVFNPTKVVTISFLFGLIYFVGSILSNYKLALSEVDERIVKHPQIIRMQIQLEDQKETTDKHEVKIQGIEAQLNARKR